MTLTESVASLQSAVDGACAEIDRLRKVKWELLEALKRIAGSEPRPNRNHDYDASAHQDLQRLARAAIQKAER